jgi:hypothetical protein
MKKWITVGMLGLALVVTGCQKTSTTGPGGTKVGGGTTDKKELTLTAATSQTLARGASDKVMLTINRDNFSDPVKVRFENLPTGVTVVDKDITIASGDNKATVTLQADATAPIGDHQVKIVAEAPGVAPNEQAFKLTIKEKS